MGCVRRADDCVPDASSSVMLGRTATRMPVTRGRADRRFVQLFSSSSRRNRRGERQRSLDSNRLFPAACPGNAARRLHAAKSGKTRYHRVTDRAGRPAPNRPTSNNNGHKVHGFNGLYLSNSRHTTCEKSRARGGPPGLDSRGRRAAPLPPEQIKHVGSRLLFCHSHVPAARRGRDGRKLRRTLLAQRPLGADDRLRRLQPGEPGEVLSAPGADQDAQRAVLRRPAREGTVSGLSQRPAARQAARRAGQEPVPPQLRRQPQLHADVHARRPDGQRRRRHAALHADGAQPRVARP